MLSREQQLLDMVNRMGIYLSSRDASFWDVEYFAQVLDVEYPELMSVFTQQGKDVFQSSIKASPVGMQILQNELGLKFVEALFELIQNPEPDAETAAAEVLPSIEPPKRGRRVEKNLN